MDALSADFFGNSALKHATETSLNEEVSSDERGVSSP